MVNTIAQSENYGARPSKAGNWELVGYNIQRELLKL